ncbi:F-BAR domain only protein 1, partial [Dissostichus eleginoides]
GHLRREALQDPQDPVIPKPPRNTTKQYTAHWEASADAERRGGGDAWRAGIKRNAAPKVNVQMEKKKSVVH